MKMTPALFRAIGFKRIRLNCRPPQSITHYPGLDISFGDDAIHRGITLDHVVRLIIGRASHFTYCNVMGQLRTIKYNPPVPIFDASRKMKLRKKPRRRRR